MEVFLHPAPRKEAPRFEAFFVGTIKIHFTYFVEIRENSNKSVQRNTCNFELISFFSKTLICSHDCLYKVFLVRVY